MTVNDLIAEIERLPVNEQLRVIETVTRHLRETVAGTSTERLRGILDLGDPPPTKEQIRVMYTDYLEEKYR